LALNNEDLDVNDKRRLIARSTATARIEVCYSFSLSNSSLLGSIIW
jgi:hypothetical protein